MKNFITTRPEAEPARFDSSFDPVLSGVAQGLARLFPPVEHTRKPQDGSEHPHPAQGLDDEAGGEGERG